MIDIEAWLRELDEEEDVDIKNNEEYQTGSTDGQAESCR